ncbi:response regulatory protein [Streptococcus pyogenes]|nr:response regulator [Streptococcus pyogenes]VGQ71640.1 response regulator [Streptococcus pyogenes]VGU92408.1 response regulatory protein [Streptococcus pyogenes]
MNIFILEDNFLQQTRIEKVVHEVLYDNDWPYRHCEVYGKPDQLLADVQERGSHQIFFLDIEIKDEEKKRLRHCT